MEQLRKSYFAHMKLIFFFKVVILSSHRDIKLVYKDNLGPCDVGYYSRVHYECRTPKLSGCYHVKD